MSELLDSAVVGAVARLKTEPQEKWLAVLQEFAAEVQAISSSDQGGQATQAGKCADCGMPAERCAKCTAKAAAAGFVKERARDAVTTYGPILASKGLEWLQSVLEDAKRAEGGSSDAGGAP